MRTQNSQEGNAGRHESMSMKATLVLPAYHRQECHLIICVPTYNFKVNSTSDGEPRNIKHSLGHLKDSHMYDMAKQN